MPPTRILVAEDDVNIRNGLIDVLESEGYQVDPAEDGPAALNLFARRRYDLIILDIMMPGESGYDVCRDIRRRDQRVPIVMLTAKSEEIDKVVGLQLGADDYITKPFGVHELLARIAAVLRRALRQHPPAEEAGNANRFQFGTATVDAGQHRLEKEEGFLTLSVKELHLLCFFHRHPNQVLDRDQLLNAVWGINYLGTTRTLDQHIALLRKKVEPDPRRPRFIVTVHGVGYRYEKTQT